MGKSEIQSMRVQHPSETNLVSVTTPVAQKMFTIADDDVEDVPFSDDNEHHEETDSDRIDVFVNQVAGHHFGGNNAGKLIVLVLLERVFQKSYV